MSQRSCFALRLLVGYLLLPWHADAGLNEAPFNTILSFPGYDRPEGLTNFPALIVLNEDIYGFRYEQFASPEGSDLRFTDADGTTVLAHEIDAWNTNGDSYVWVRLPALEAGTEIQAYWGDVLDTTPPSYTTNGAVWAGEHEAVLHLQDFALRDSAANGFDGVNAGSTETAGLIGNARNVVRASSQHINCGSGMDLAGKSFTISTWARRGLTGSAVEGYIVSHGMAGPPDRMGLHVGFRGGAEADQFALGFWGDDLNSPGTYPDTNDWHLWAATYEAATKTQTLYVDGSRVASRIAGDDYAGLLTEDLLIGTRFDGVAFDGAIDEVRVSSASRSSNWIWAVYANAASNGSFVAQGPVEGGPLPYIEAVSADDVAPDTAYLQGNVVVTGHAPATAYAYYGTTDSGTNASAWDHVVSVDVTDEGPVFAGISGLDSATTYFFRFYITNALGDHWSTSALNFTTPAPRLRPETFARRMQIRFEGYDRNETLTNFPLLIVLHEGLSDFDYGDFASPAGNDLRFADHDGVTLLNHEIDRWDTAGTSFVWVQVPELSPDGSIYAFWGRPGGTTAPSSLTNGTVWAENYHLVLHLNTNPVAGTFLDSTAFGLTATNNGTFDDAGLIGRSRDMNDNAFHNIRGGNGLDISNKSFTVSIWNKRFTADYGSSDYLVSHGSPTDHQGLHYGFVDPNTIRFSLWADDLDHYSTNYADVTEWHLMTATFNADTRRQTIYFDGVETSWRTAFETYQGSVTSVLRIANAFADPGSYYDGRIDETRISDVDRSSNWIWACWFNQKSNASFSSYGPAEKAWAPLPALVLTSFTHRARIAIDGYAGDGPLTNFPLLVKLGPAIPGFDYETFVSPDGADLRFTSSDGTSELSYEIERWNPPDESFLWVRIPILSTGDHIYAYWGGDTSAQPPALGLRLWLNAGSGVQTNLAGGVTNWLDQSGNGNDVSPPAATNTPALTANAFNGEPALMFEGNDRLIRAAPSLPQGDAPRTVILVARSTNGTGDIYPFAYGSPEVNRTFGIDLGGDIRVVAFGNDEDIGFDGDTSLHLYAFLYDGGVIESYEDGLSGIAHAKTYDTSISNLFVGSFTDGGFHYDGSIAEILVYDRILSKTEINDVGFYLGDKYGLSTTHTEAPYYTADGSTWTEGFQTVLHMDQGFLDSSYLGNDTTNFGTFPIDAQVSRGRQFQKTFADHLQGGSELDLADRSFSLSVWAKRSVAGEFGDGFFMSHGTAGVINNGLHFGFRGGTNEADTLTFAFWGDDLNSYDASYANTSDWHLWTATFETGTRRQAIYRDGVLMAERTANSNYQDASSTILRVGEFFGTSYYDGGMDEFRVSGSLRSSNWVWAAWRSQKQNDSFLNYHRAGFIDRDEDGMPDYWEELFFDGPTNGLSGAHDDTDTLSNIEEYIADTDPTDSDSFFHISYIQRDGPATVYFDASTARVYTLQFSSNAVADIWLDLPGQVHVPGSGNDSSLVDSNTAGIRNYRLEVELP